MAAWRALVRNGSWAGTKRSGGQYAPLEQGGLHSQALRGNAQILFD